MSALDVGLIAVFLWTCLTLWIAYAGPTIVSRSGFRGGTGWSRATLTLAEEGAIRSLFLYTLAFHVAIWAVYWVVRRFRKYNKTTSDVVSLAVAALLTVCYLPAFMAGLALDCTLVELLWPHGLATLASHLAYLDASDRPFVYASVIIKLTAFVPAALVYAAACFPSTVVSQRG